VSSRRSHIAGSNSVRTACLWGASFLLLVPPCVAQQGQQPPPFTVPQPPLPAATDSPGQRPLPSQQQPGIPPDAPLPRPDQTTVDLRDLKPLSSQTASLAKPSPAINRVTAGTSSPRSEAGTAFNTHFYNFVAPYRSPSVPNVPMNSGARLSGLVRDGKLYLSLTDAIALAIENNLDVEISRYNLLLTETDITRARGGGTLRGFDFTIQQTPMGIGAVTSPLLNTASNGTASPANINVTDLSQVTQSGTGAQQSLAYGGTAPYSAGPALPLYDPTIIAQAGYLRRSNQTSLIDTTGTTGSSSGTGTATNTEPLSFLSTGIDYQQGFSTGAQLEAYVDNAAQVLYSNSAQYNPFHAPSTNFTLTQPMLRGRGRGVNLRFIRIAKLDQKASRLIFEQQILETIYGISRLYYDLVSLGENIGVKEQSLASADQLYRDDKDQVIEGTLAPIELTRAQSLLSSSRLDLIQARGEYRQQEVILRQQLLRKLGDPIANFAAIIPTDHILVPDTPPALDVPAMTADALANRPDLAQAALQIQAGEIATSASRNGTKPLLNVYANVQTRGSALVPYQSLGTTGTGLVTVPPALTQGGLRLSTIYQAGVQLNMPLRNRIAQADAARDAIQLRQTQGRTAKLENDIRQQIENSAIALENAHQAYAAAVESRNYQQQLLQAEMDKFAVGASTNFMIIQDQSYLAQARSTEVAARSDWMKARISLDRALGNLLEKNNISLDDAVTGKLN
jgi:outer membrane protein